MVLYYWLFSLLASISLSVLYVFREHWSYSTASNLPPGRLGWPVIGESLEFLSAIRAGCPEKFFFDRAVKCPDETDGAAFKTSLLGEPSVVLCGAAGNKFIFSNEEKLVTSWVPRSLMKLFIASEQTSASTEAKKFRKLLPGLLKIDNLRRNVGIMDEVARRNFTAGSGWDSVAKKYTFRVAARLIASLDEPEEIKKWEEPFATVESGMFSIPVNLPGTTLNRALKALKVMRKEVVKVIKRRKVELAEGTASTEQQDLLSNMLLMQNDDGHSYSELEIATFIIGLFQVSHGTTSSTCASIVKYLTDLPRVYEVVYNEQMTIAKSKRDGELLNWEELQRMKYSWNVAREVLRLAPPTPIGFREAIADFTFGGFSVRKGWKVFWSTSATHRDPAYFPDPHTFDPTRFEGSGPAPNTFVPFGGGPRMCTGREYARAKILVFMHNLVNHRALQ